MYSTVNGGRAPKGVVGLLIALTGCPAILPGEHAKRVDADGDGYLVAGYGDGDDCDDNSAEVHPGLSEVCGDGLDNDCDGTANTCGMSGVMDLSESGLVIVPQERGDKVGYAVANAGDLDGDGTEDVIVGAPGLDGSLTDVGAVYVLLGGPPTTVGDILLANADLKVSGATENEQAGQVVGGAGDMDGDGYGDILVGAPLRNSGDEEKVGAYYVVYGPSGPSRTLLAADASGVGTSDNDRLGTALVAGNFAGDATLDLAVGAPYRNVSGSKAGEVYLFLGGVAGTKNPNKADHVLSGVVGDEAGTALASADIDGDGIDDLVVGSPNYDGGGDDAGTAFVLLGPIESDVPLATGSDGVVTKMSAGDHAGSALALGDVDGDGTLDLVLGSPDADGVAVGAGLTHIIHGPLTGGLQSEATLEGQTIGDGVGAHIAVGDIDADGVDDVALGAPNRDANGVDTGLIYVVYGPFSGSFALGRAEAKLGGVTEKDYAGTGLAIVDWDGSGSGDLLAGAWGQDLDGSANNGGLVYVWLVKGL